jgi:hypothetical protein
MLVTGSTIAKLLQRPRMWAFRRIAAGDFGPVYQRGPAYQVELGRVEAATGMQFTPSQLAAAGITPTKNMETPDGQTA